MPKNNGTASTRSKKKTVSVSKKKQAKAKPVETKWSISGYRKSLSQQAKEYLSRRPHRSFRRTRRRDYERSLKLPGYFSFSHYVTKTLLAHKRLFGGLVVFYGVMSVLLIGLASQDTYSQFTALLDETGGGLFDGNWGAIGQAGLLFMAGASGGFGSNLTEAQQIYSLLLLLLMWLATVWSLRAILASNEPKVRDVLYNSGAPIVSTLIVLIVAFVQLLPVALAVVIVNAATSTDMFASPVMSLLISIVVGLLGLLSLYWITSTLIALVVVTLPGMYPWRAVKTAGDLVIGRRIRILLRLVWMAIVGLLITVVIMIPVILLDMGLKHALPLLEPVPIVPVMLTVVSSIVVLWTASYIYLLYRKVVEDDADPA